MTQLLRTAEVSARINTKMSTLRYWRHKGEGPPSFGTGPHVVYPLDGLERSDRTQPGALHQGRSGVTVAPKH